MQGKNKDNNPNYGKTRCWTQKTKREKRTKLEEAHHKISKRVWGRKRV